MRRKILCSFLYTILIYVGINNCYCQSTKFYKLYAGNNDLQLFTVHQTQNNGYIAAGKSTSTIGGNYLILKVDSNGNEMWRSLGGLFNTLDSDNVTYSATEYFDGGIIACGTITQFHPGIGLDHQNFLVKIDSTGNLVWQKAIGNDTCYETLWDLKSFTNGEIICAGIKATTQSNLSIIKYDSAGTQMWETNYTMGNYFANKSYIYDCFNSDVLILTALSSYGSVLTRIDSGGTILKQQYFLDTLFSYPVTVSEVAPFRYKLIRQSNSTPFDALISELDSNFNILNTYYTGPVNSAAIIDSINSYCCAVEMSCWKCGLTGDTVWKSSIIDPRLVPTFTIVTHDGCALNCGVINHDATGYSVGFLWSVCDSSLLAGSGELFKDKIRIYPIPTSGLINLDIDSDVLYKFKNIFLIITDSMGQTVLQTEVNKSEMQIELDRLKSGIYTFNFIANNQRLYSRAIVIN